MRPSAFRAFCVISGAFLNMERPSRPRLPMLGAEFRVSRRDGGQVVVHDFGLAV
jgi:hypothetical protein